MDRHDRLVDAWGAIEGILSGPLSVWHACEWC